MSTAALELTMATIPVRTERRAMEWSLALVSQGIEVVIDHVPGGEGWVLRVPPEELARAEEVIHLYCRENRGWGWRQQFAGTALAFHWGALLWCWLVIGFYWLTEGLSPGLLDAGIMDRTAVRQGEWWRLFTAVFLHGDVAHLAANLSTGLLVVGLAMARFGAGPGLLAAYLAGAGGNLLGLLLRQQPYHGLGASGMVMGALGLLVVPSLPLWRAGPHGRRQALGGLAAGGFLFLLLGVSEASDVLAHLGGLLSGVIFGGLLALFPAESLRTGWPNRLAAGGAAVLAALTWVLALR